MSNQEWQLVKYPVGMPQEDDFKLVDVPEPKEEDLQDGEVILELVALSVDPYMRGRMTNRESYVPAFQLNTAISSHIVGTIVKSKAENIKEGSSYSGVLPHKKRQIVKGAALVPVFPSEKVPVTQFIGCLGMPGLTAYLSLKNIAEPKEGEYAFVSGGAGAVGSTVIQLLKAQGLKVIASAGSDDKVALCKELGADEAFNYKTVGTGPELEKTLSSFAPNGLNIYYDNVGGRTLEAALNCMARCGRVVCCGAISQYNNKDVSESFGVRNLFMLIGKSLKMQGFIVSNWMDQFAEGVKTLAQMYTEGKIAGKQTILEGFDKMPQAMIGLLNGDNIGKMVVKC